MSSETVARIRLALQGHAAVAQGIKAVETQIGGLKTAITGLAAGLTVGAFAGFVRTAINAADAMAKTAAKTGLAVESIAGLQLAYRQSGQSGDALEKTMSSLSRRMAEGHKAFVALGLSVRNADGSLKGVRAMLGEVADKFATYQDGAAKAALAQELFGKAGLDMIPMLNGGSDALDRMDETARRLGLTLDAETASRAEQFNDTLDTMQQGLVGAGRQIAAALLPTLNTMAGELLTTANNTDTLRTASSALGTLLKGLFTLAAGGVQIFVNLGRMVGAAGAAIMAILDGEFSQARSIMEKARIDNTEAWKTSVASITRVWDEAGNQAMNTGVAMVQSAQAPVVALGKTAKAVRQVRDEFADLQNRLTAQDAGISPTYYKELETLHAAYRQGRIDLDRYRVLVEKLTQSQKFAQDIARKRAEQERALASAIQAQREAEYRRVSALADGAAALRASNDALEEELKTTGLSRRELVAYTRAKLQAEIATRRAALASAQSAHMYTREQAALEEHIAQLERQIDLLERRAQQEDMHEAHAAHLDMWASIDRTAHDVFVNIWEDGAGTFKRLGQTLKAAVLDWLYQLTVRRWVVHLAASFSGAPASAVAGALGGGQGGGVLGNLGSVGNLGGLFGGGAYGSLWGLGNLGSGLGAGWAALGSEAGFGGAMSAGWSSITAGNIGGGLGTWAGAVAPWALGIGGGAAIGRAISNGYAISGSGNGVSNAGAVVGAIIGSIIPGIGTAIGALLGGLLGGATGGLLNRAFGRRLSDTGFEGTLGGAEGFTGRSWQHYRGGWFRSDKTRYGEISAEFQRSIAQTYIGLRDQLGAYASVLQLPVDKIHDFTHQIRLSLHGLRPEEAAQRIQEALAGAQEELARQILRGWTGAAASDEFQLAYQREGETNVQTLERLALSLTTVNAAFEAMGRTLLDASVWGGDLASQITDLFGQGQAGRDAFAAAASGYMSNYYTEAERRAALQRQVQRQFDALGLTMPDINAEDARAQFRHLVDSLDLATESGRRAYAALMALQGAFAELTPAMTDASEAARAAADAARAAAEAQLAAARTATDAAMRGLESAIRREIGTWQTTLRGAQEDAAQARAVMQAAGGASRQLYGQSDPTRAMLARQGQDYIARALSGARAGLLPDAGELGRAIEAARGGLNVNDYASYAEYERAQLVLAGRLAEMEELGGQQLTAAERQEELARTQINQLEKTLDYWRRQLDLARGQADSLLSIDQATSAIAKALAEERAAKEAAAKEAAKGAEAAKGGGASGGGGGSTYWQPSSKGTWDEENQRLNFASGGYIDYRTGKRHYADGSVSISAVPEIELERFKREALEQLEKERAHLGLGLGRGVPGYARGTNYVTHDHVAIVHEGERILPAADNRALMRALDAGGARSGGDAELRALRAEVAGLRALLARVADASERSARVLRDASDGDALQIREAAA